MLWAHDLGADQVADMLARPKLLALRSYSYESYIPIGFFGMISVSYHRRLARAV